MATEQDSKAYSYLIVFCGQTGFFFAYLLLLMLFWTTRYGDKTPKSTFARLFAVVWIMIGVTMCSILTATLSSALTSVNVERYDFTTGKTVRRQYVFSSSIVGVL